MGGRYKLVFWGALAVAAVATFGAYRLLGANKTAEPVTHAVVVASRDIPAGTRIDRAAISVAPWPVRMVPPGAFASIDSVAGRIARTAIFSGDAIVPGRLAPIGSEEGLEVKIPPGKRAMAVRINDVAGISGLLQPNSRVDVLVTLREDGSGRQVAKLFMSNMLVLSVGSEVERVADRPIDASSVTLAVTPREAERLAAAMTAGAIQLVLRGYGDPDSVRTAGATSSEVVLQMNEFQPKPEAVRTARARVARPRVEAPPKAPEPRRPPDSARIEIYRAGQAAVQQKFDTTVKR